MKTSLIFILIISVTACSKSSGLDSDSVLERSISYHDPEGEWEKLKASLSFEEEQPDGNVRNTSAWIDMPNSYFKLNRGDYEIHGMVQDSCFIEKGDVDCARARRMRDYYVYLWGLPMKLMDEGTQLLDSVGKTTWEGKEAYVLFVDYEKDDWKYYFDKETYQMIGYEFLQTTGNSEKILLEGIMDFGNMKIPAERSWYMTSDNDRFLGTDRLVRVSVF